MWRRVVRMRRSTTMPRSPTPTPAENVDKETGKPVPQSHPHVSQGDWGTTESLLRPAGRAVFRGVSLDVVSDGSYVEPGCQVRVIEISGNRIVVTEIEGDDETVWKGDQFSRDDSEKADG